ncbi:MAG TPA: hypothetical protein VLL76_00605, partial [Candidatus Omnitrophota bacterium]|nr:hypothetical protein [Candidatus Omnitrophota bacterium]
SGPVTAPLYAYDNTLGEAAVVGGTVYRGPAEAMQGQYVFADFVSGRVWTLAGGEATERSIETDFGTLDRPTSFGEDARYRLYLTDYDGDLYRLVPQGSGPATADTIDGLGGGDVLFGGGGADVLTGGDGIDRLVGQGGDDRLVGGAGNDILDGGPGADEFVIAPGTGTDTIADFEDGDVIVIDGPGTADQLLADAEARGSGSFIALGQTDGIVIAGIDPSQLLASDFAFV